VRDKDLVTRTAVRNASELGLKEPPHSAVAGSSPLYIVVSCVKIYRDLFRLYIAEIEVLQETEHLNNGPFFLELNTAGSSNNISYRLSAG
jgi:hypothetical protein